jgi:hypothetical protein
MLITMIEPLDALDLGTITARIERELDISLLLCGGSQILSRFAAWTRTASWRDPGGGLGLE